MLLLLLPLLTGSLTSAAPDPCAVVTPAEIASALGSQPTPGKPRGPDEDEDTGATAWTCSRQVGKRMLWVAVMKFSNAAGATKGIDLVIKSSREMDDAIQLSPVAGVADQALWGASKDGAMWVVRKGRYLVNFTVGGEGNHASLQEGLKRLAVLAAGRVGS